MDPNATCQIECLGNTPQDGYTASIKEYRPMSGQGLMQLGARLERLDDYDVRILHLKSIDK